VTPIPLDIAALKNRLRNESLARRDALDPDDRAAGSEAIADRILGLGIEGGAIVSAFLPIRSEVDLRPAIAHLFTAGHRIGLPVIRKPDLCFREWIPDAPLIPLGFGTYGPTENAAVVIPDAMLVPLSVFDRTGGRIGYGKAYYDLTIAGYHAIGHRPRLIGVAFSVQEAEEVPMEPHDVRLHLIVTERDVIIPHGAG
jgi:5-formyltetrahydrofolate cyclo-ligase